MEHIVAGLPWGCRRSIRLPGHDYSSGVYFLTICTRERRCLLGQIREGRFTPNLLGQIAWECWAQIPEHFSNVSIHEFVFMPNHLHGLLSIEGFVEAQRGCALSGGAPSRGRPGSLGAIVRSFKAIVARRAHEELRWQGPVWQRNYFERALRVGEDLSDSARYIRENPKRWEFDRENPEMRLR